MPTLQEQAKSINDLIDQAQTAANKGDIETARKLQEEITQAKDAYNSEKEVVDSVSAEEKNADSISKINKIISCMAASPDGSIKKLLPFP